MHSKVYFIIFFVFVSVSSYAVSAYPYSQKVTQPDGKKINILLKGDEHLSWAETEDGYSIIFNKSGIYEYAVLNTSKELVSSGIRAANAEQRNARDIQFLKKTPKHLVFSPVQTSIMQSLRSQRAKAQKKARSRHRVI